MTKEPTTAERQEHAKRLVEAAQYLIEHETGSRSERLDWIIHDLDNGDTESAVKKLTAGKKATEIIKPISEKGFDDTYRAGRNYNTATAYLLNAYGTLTETTNNGFNAQ